MTTCHVLAALLALIAVECPAQAPQRNLVVQFRAVDAEQVRDEPSRQADADQAPAPPNLTISTRRATPNRPAFQQLQLLNGEWGSVHVGTSQPIQWIRAVSGSASAASPSASSAGGARGTVVSELTWLQAGQSLAVRVRWPGGDKPAVVDIQVRTAQVDEHVGSEMPATSSSEARTTLAVPLERWTTFASSQDDSGPALRGITVSTLPRNAPQRLAFQVLVHQP